MLLFEGPHEQSCGGAGQGIAVSYGRFDVEGWCLQPGKLCTWNLARPGFDASKPDTSLEVDSCLQCCACHPQQPVRLSSIKSMHASCQTCCLIAMPVKLQVHKKASCMSCDACFVVRFCMSAARNVLNLGRNCLSTPGACPCCVRYTEKALHHCYILLIHT